MCSLTTSTYACTHPHKKYWTYCSVVATQKENPKYAKAKTCQGPQRVREEKEEVLQKKCDDCRIMERAEKGKGGWLARLRAR